ncbi:hypothetical protein RJ639_040969 [Escallonia herrerae]|uniref:Pre-mRNA polyadenylation factor Fip1 domain-containing protein n=1 Tax=Escallonia herrerae TaxID=1293975 RepID=A0AA88WCV1_9ASTE|nr:hypothetical protein RJ639_040969 [Escallonia herrerae]
MEALDDDFAELYADIFPTFNPPNSTLKTFVCDDHNPSQGFQISVANVVTFKNAKDRQVTESGKLGFPGPVVISPLKNNHEFSPQPAKISDHAEFVSDGQKLGNWASASKNVDGLSPEPPGQAETSDVVGDVVDDVVFDGQDIGISEQIGISVSRKNDGLLLEPPGEAKDSGVSGEFMFNCPEMGISEPILSLVLKNDEGSSREPPGEAKISDLAEEYVFNGSEAGILVPNLCSVLKNNDDLSVEEPPGEAKSSDVVEEFELEMGSDLNQLEMGPKVSSMEEMDRDVVTILTACSYFGLNPSTPGLFDDAVNSLENRQNGVDLRGFTTEYNFGNREECDEDNNSQDNLDIILSDDDNLTGVGSNGNQVRIDTDVTEGEDLITVASNDLDDERMEEKRLGSKVGDEKRKVMSEAAKGSGSNAILARAADSDGAFLSMSKSVTPIAGTLPGGAPGGPVAAPHNVYPFGSVDHIAGQGGGDSQSPGLTFASTMLETSADVVVSMTNNPPSGHGLGNKLNFLLPTVFDINVDDLEEKPWRRPGVDLSVFFNYGLDEHKWKYYSKQMKQLRMEMSAQSHFIARKNGKFEKPIGRAVDVEAGKHLPCIEVESPHLQNSDVIIEIVCQDHINDNACRSKDAKVNLVLVDAKPTLCLSKDCNTGSSKIHKNINGDWIRPFPLYGSCQRCPGFERPAGIYQEERANLPANPEKRLRKINCYKKNPELAPPTTAASNLEVQGTGETYGAVKYVKQKINQASLTLKRKNHPRRTRAEDKSDDERNPLHDYELRFGHKMYEQGRDGDGDAHLPQRRKQKECNFTDQDKNSSPRYDDTLTYPREYLDKPPACEREPILRDRHDIRHWIGRGMLQQPYESKPVEYARSAKTESLWRNTGGQKRVLPKSKVFKTGCQNTVYPTNRKEYHHRSHDWKVYQEGGAEGHSSWKQRDIISSNQQQGLKRGRSKFERWTSHDELDKDSTDSVADPKFETGEDALKLKKRRERFKSPVPNAEDATFQMIECESEPLSPNDAIADSEIKHQRPERREKGSG